MLAWRPRAASVLLLLSLPALADPLPNTSPLKLEGDPASQMVDGIDRFLDKQIAKAPAARDKFWPAELRAPFGEESPLAARRARLAEILGVRDPRPASVEMELVATIDQPALVGRCTAFEVLTVRWRAFGDVHGEGLLLRPFKPPSYFDVVAIPDADETPEQAAGLVPGGRGGAFARHLASQGCRVLVPTLIDRHAEPRVAPSRMDGPVLSNREFIYRQAFDLGRHVIGYELQKVLAGIDWLTATRGKGTQRTAVVGYGEGGMLALQAAALDTRVSGVVTAGHFGRRERTWREPIERNVWCGVSEFGDAELAAMAAQHAIVVVGQTTGPAFKVAGAKAAPGELSQPEGAAEEFERAKRLAGETAARGMFIVGEPDDERGLTRLMTEDLFVHIGWGPTLGRGDEDLKHLRAAFDPAPRKRRQLDELTAHTQALIAASRDTRRAFMSKLDVSSVAKYEASAKPYREHFERETLGRFDEPLLPLNPRTRKLYDTPKFTGHEVMLDVFPDVFAYGVLLLPKDLKEGDRRPVVVCQHGLEGRPKDCIEGNNPAYHDYAAKLAERGFIVFAPQNPYIFGDRFRVLNRKANPLGKSIWSIIVPQHRQIIAFLKTLPHVDAKRIAFYGLSYGGKSAMRLPAAIEDYCLSICSADFNEWVEKNASTRLPSSYVFTGEYEIFEWDLGSTFNYAEMAALIAPRPFMVERGHFDGVSSDELVAFEFAKVRNLYAARLKMPPAACQIEWFDGPHTINGKGTFEFLHHHLSWEKR